MGYGLHITRAEDWASNEGEGITPEEWLDVVNGDPELLPQPDNGPYFVEWHGGAGEEWLDWFEGRVYAKYPSEALIRKMCEIAEMLSARVQGDDGEFYPESLEEAGRPQRDPWWLVLQTCSLLLLVTSIALLWVIICYPKWFDAQENTLPFAFATALMIIFMAHFLGFVVTALLTALFALGEHRMSWTATGALVLGIVPILILFLGG